jgi:subtilisin family serine protease
MKARTGRRGLVAIVGLAALAAACTPVVTPPPPTTTTTTPPAPVACQSDETRSVGPDVPGATTFEAVVDDGLGAPEAVTFDAATAADVSERVADIEATLGPVTSVGEEVPVSILAVEPGDDPEYGSAPFRQKAALDWSEFDAAWTAEKSGAGVVVAVVDSGVDGAHPDLAGQLIPGNDFVASTGGNGCVDPNSHGTHVAGIIGQADNTVGGIGAASGVQILPVRVLGASGGGSSTDVANGITWAVDNGADVINLSLGGSDSPAIHDAVDYALANGVAVVAAAGNCGQYDAEKCPVVNAPLYPAAYPGVIAVGALSVNGSPNANTRASFSNNNTYIAIAAPGVSIYSSVPGGGYGAKSGTSMAAPFAAAAVALILEVCEGESPAAVMSKLQSAATATATDFAQPVKVLDAFAASAAPCTP